MGLDVKKALAVGKYGSFPWFGKACIHVACLPLSSYIDDSARARTEHVVSRNLSHMDTVRSSF